MSFSCVQIIGKKLLICARGRKKKKKDNLDIIIYFVIYLDATSNQLRLISYARRTKRCCMQKKGYQRFTRVLRSLCAACKLLMVIHILKSDVLFQLLRNRLLTIAKSYRPRSLPCTDRVYRFFCTRL